MQITDTELVRSITHRWQGESDGGGRLLVLEDILELLEMVTHGGGLGESFAAATSPQLHRRPEVPSSRDGTRGQGVDLAGLCRSGGT